MESGATLTRQLLGYARGGKYQVTPVNLNETVQRTTDMFGRTKKEIQIHTRYQKEIWTVEADQGHLFAGHIKNFGKGIGFSPRITA